MDDLVITTANLNISFQDNNCFLCNKFPLFFIFPIEGLLAFDVTLNVVFSLAPHASCIPPLHSNSFKTFSFYSGKYWKFWQAIQNKKSQHEGEVQGGAELAREAEEDSGGCKIDEVFV